MVPTEAVYRRTAGLRLRPTADARATDRSARPAPSAATGSPARPSFSGRPGACIRSSEESGSGYAPEMSLGALRRAGLFVLASTAVPAAGGLAACTLGFDRFAPSADASADGTRGDARADGNGGLDVVEGGQPLPEAGTSPDGCAGALDCVGEAGACGAACGQTSQQCQSQCPNTGCRNGCIKAEQSCRSGCASACATCTQAEGCSTQAGCPDAAGAP